jgi:hypothetical protein
VAALPGQPEALGHDVRQQRRVLQPGKLHEAYPVPVAIRGLAGRAKREASLAYSAWTDDCDQPGAVQERRDPGELSLPADKARYLGGQPTALSLGAEEPR